MDALDRIRLFHLVADKGSFAEAARHMGVSPVAASRAVAALEDAIGTQLFRRASRSVRLTDPGAEYVARTRPVLTELEDAARAVRGEGAEPRGQLVVTAPVLFGRLHVSEVVATMLQRYSKLTVRLLLVDRRVRLVEEGVDAAVRIGDLPDSSLRVTPLATVKRVLVASPRYLAQRGAPKKAEDLAKHDLIAFDTFTPNSEWLIGDRRIRVAPRLLTNNVDAAIDASMRGLGITRLISYQVESDVLAGRLVRVLDKLSGETLPVSILYNADRQQSANVKAFIDVAREIMPGCPKL